MPEKEEALPEVALVVPLPSPGMPKCPEAMDVEEGPKDMAGMLALCRERSNGGVV